MKMPPGWDYTGVWANEYDEELELLGDELSVYYSTDSSSVDIPMAVLVHIVSVWLEKKSEELA